jgi:hypothetical protein
LVRYGAEEGGFGIATRYIGGDVSEKMLAIAKKRLPDTELMHLDIFDIPVQDQLYDNVICIQVLQHLPDYREALRELIFSAPSDKWDGQRFYNNHYSLSGFIKDIYISGRDNIRDIVVHRFYNDPNYSVFIKFDSVG